MQYTYEDFNACLEQTFLLQQDGVSDELQLIQVDLFDSAPAADGGRQPFSIVFRSSSQDVLPQQTYQLSHATLGEMQIFIVPIGQDETGVRYEAVFS